MRQPDLQTLPEGHTDFVFSVSADWSALLGLVVVLTVAGWLAWRWWQR